MCDVEHVTCPVCGSDESHDVFTAQAHRAADEAFRIVQCDRCGLRYTNPRPTAEAIGRYYPDAYYRDDSDPKQRPARQRGWREAWTQMALRCHMGYPGRCSPVQRLISWPRAWQLRRGLKHVDAVEWTGEGRLLDFGCGGGKFLRLQRDRGWAVAGIDFNETVARWAREEDGIDVVSGTWPGDAMSGRTFDVITAWHVLEHLPDPVGWMRSAVERLAPGGRLIVACPDSDSWAAQRFGRHWYGLDVPLHFSHFTKHDLARLMEKAGLQVERIRSQHRTRPTIMSSRLSAQHHASRRGKMPSCPRIVWRVYAWVASICGKADCVIVVGQKPR
jgi:2-polyprenyl-3-methyl-5-hydroxy-6-metoxy-1,4-benzoquinol methylase